MVRKFEVVPISEIAVVPEPEHYRPVILVVDDEMLIADTLATILSQRGFAATAAYRAESALAIAAATPPDVLISDVAMPGMTGIDLAIAISIRFTECKILLISGQAHISDLLADSRAEGYDFQVLTKPIHPRILLEHIWSCLADYSPGNNTETKGEFTLSREG